MNTPSITLKVPQLFYGKYQKVKAELRKVMTKLKRGYSVEEIFDSEPMLDINDYPDSLLWLDRSGSSIGGKEHFPLCILGEALFLDERFTYEEKLRLKQEFLDYLYQLPWGVIAINASQEYSWAGLGIYWDSPGVDPDDAARILEGTCWDEQPTKINYSEITNVVFDSRYVNIFSKYLSEPPALAEKLSVK